MLWPHEIKSTLGLDGSIQDLWLEPVALVPHGLPIGLCQPVQFHPSARHDGLLAIDVRNLKAGLTYDVEFDDRRKQITDALTREEKTMIETTFREYDIDGDGTIDKEECTELVRVRSEQRRAAVDEQYLRYLEDNPTNPDASEEAEQLKREQYQKIQEAQDKMLSMYEHADLDGNGRLTLEEFALAESWWMKCTIDPDKIAVFH